MLSSELYYRVNSIEKDVITINDFEYLRVNVTIAGNIEFYIYMSIKQVENIKEGNYYHCKKAFMTSHYGLEEVIDGDFSFRVDSLINSSKEEFDAQENTFVRFNAKIGKRPVNTIKYLGPARIPTFSVRASIKNELDQFFSVFVIGFHGKAKILNNLASVTYVDVIGYISPPKHEGKSCAIILKEHILRKEVEA